MSIVDEDLGSLSLVDETAIDKDFADLVTFDANLVHGDLRFTSEQLDAMNNQMLRRLAQYADTNEINGKSTQLEIVHYFNCQHTLSDYSE